ncbi:broad specificity phosphatase PhoE [Bradyrhizobium sp. RT4b]
MDAFDRFWQWANKPLESLMTLPADLHRAVMELAPETGGTDYECSARHVALVSSGISSRTVTPVGMLEAISMRPSS